MADMTTPCEGYYPYADESIGSVKECRNPAETRIVVGCRHEHVASKNYCRYHTQVVRDGELLCGNCLDAPDGAGHECYLRGAFKRVLAGDRGEGEATTMLTIALGLVVVGVVLDKGGPVVLDYLRDGAAWAWDLIVAGAGRIADWLA